MRWSILLAVMLVLGVTACDRSPCEKTCRRVAQCKRDKANGGEVPADARVEADPTCMARCEAQKPEFAACEEKKRICSELFTCLPY